MNKLIDNLIHSSKVGEVLRFVIVGIIATCIHYMVYWMFGLFMNDSIAFALGYCTSFIFNYILSNFFTFKSRPSIKNGVGFTLSHIINLGLQLILLNVFLSIDISNRIAPLFVWSITIPINFLLVRFFLKNR